MHGRPTPTAVRKFIEVLEVGRRPSDRRPRRARLERAIAALAAVSQARKQIASLVPGVGAPNVDLAAIDSPHALADVDVAILPGQFAVAENAAVWVTDQHVPLRVLYFLCQHLVLVVPADADRRSHARRVRTARVAAERRSAFAEPISALSSPAPRKRPTSSSRW